MKIKVTLKDGRTFQGTKLMEQKDNLDVVWEDNGVNFQACIDKTVISNVVELPED
jgi:hypothetical protein